MHRFNQQTFANYGFTGALCCSTENQSCPLLCRGSSASNDDRGAVSSMLHSRKPPYIEFLQQMIFLIWYKIYRQSSATRDVLKVSDEAINK